MDRRFAVIVGRRAEIIAAASDPARKQLLVYRPVNQFVVPNDARAHRAKGRIKILIVECRGVFFDMAVGVDVAHRDTSEHIISMLYFSAPLPSALPRHERL